MDHPRLSARADFINIILLIEYDFSVVVVCIGLAASMKLYPVLKSREDIIVTCTYHSVLVSNSSPMTSGMAKRRTRLASAGDGCETGQFIIRLVRPHASCKIDPDHLLTVLVNGNDLRHVLGDWNMSSIYSEIGSHAPFVQPVTKTQLDNMLMTTRMLTDGMPTFPELPSPFDLFRVTMSMGLTHSAEFLYHRAQSRSPKLGAPQCSLYHTRVLAVWDRSPEGI